MRNNLKPNVYSQKRAIFFASDKLFGDSRDTASAWRLWFSGIKQRPLDVKRLLPCPPCSNKGGNGGVARKQNMAQEHIFFRLNGISTLIGRDFVQLEWEGVRVGIDKDVWDGIGGVLYEKVIGIHQQVVERGLSGDLTVLAKGGQCPNS